MSLNSQLEVVRNVLCNNDLCVLHSISSDESMKLVNKRVYVLKLESKQMLRLLFPTSLIFVDFLTSNNNW